MTRSFTDYVLGKTAEYGTKFDASNLSEQFVPYFENQKRIEVSCYDMVKRGRVGVTTGWKPSFMLLLTKRSRSSWILLSDQDRILREVH